jgi:hypothetical protein
VGEEVKNGEIWNEIVRREREEENVTRGTL